jgi:hypothetical protein
MKRDKIFGLKVKIGFLDSRIQCSALSEAAAPTTNQTDYQRLEQRQAILTKPIYYAPPVVQNLFIRFFTHIKSTHSLTLRYIMNDDFHNPLPQITTPAPGLLSNVWQSIIDSPASVLTTLLLIPIFVVSATRLLSGHSSQQIKGRIDRTVWLPSYWLPVIGHGYQM